MGALSKAALGEDPAKRRRVLGTFAVLHILQNLAHREHTAPLQGFMSRLIEVLKL